MYKSIVAVYDGEKLLGVVEVYSNHQLMIQNMKLKDKIRISYYSTPSDRCSPLAVLYTITSPPSRVCLKMKCKNTVNSNSQLNLLHSTCLWENKTAVVLLDGDELHLVAMRSRRNGSCPCFWGFNVAPGLYESCLVMLNLRCLGIVFDLDETLIVANTSKSFEDRIEALQRKLSCEVDPQRVAAMLSEIKRYQDDKNILKQYAENDQVVENGKIIKAESEAVPALSDNHQAFLRPIVRLQDKNIILTRINPLIRDTSVLVRLRPAWEDLRSYLIARGRKRFEVYVCTMAERDYALEMWRLLDPDSNLITVKELYKRIVCVKSGLKKSLFNVFQDGNCHPKMALVIDDRLKVWDERDQPRVHVVPAFAPYYAPQAEVNNAIPILCVARNVACNVRGGFFKDFDDGLLQRFNEVAYEDDLKNILPPDVSKYLVSEDDASSINGIKEALGFDGMADVEIEKRLKEAIASSTIAPTMPKPASMSKAPSGPMVQYPNKQLSHVLDPLTQVNRQETSLHSSPAREEGEVPESELDPDTRRRLLILQHGMDTRDQPTSEPAQLPVRPPSAVRVEPRGGWFPLGEDMDPRELNRIAPPLKEFSLRAEPMKIDKKHPLRAPSFVHKVEGSILPDRVLETQRLTKEIFQRDDRLRLSHSPPVHPLFSGEESSLDNETDGGDTFAEYLHYVAFKCGTMVEFKETLVPSIKLQFSFEVWFAGEKIGDGTGRTRREAQHHAAESSLMNLADKYLSLLEESSSFSAAKLETPKKGSIAALNELCMMEGLGMTFQPQPQISNIMGLNNELYAQVEIEGEMWGKGVGLTWDEAKLQAAEAAYQNLKAKIGNYPKKRHLLLAS